MTESQLPVPVSNEEIEAGKTMALLSWVGMLIGIPLFIIPLAQRDNEYALFHAKHAAMVFIIAIAMAVVMMVITVITCGFGGFLMFLMVLILIPTVDGLIKAINGKMEAPLITGGFTDSIFGGMTVAKSVAAPAAAAPAAAAPAPAAPAPAPTTDPSAVPPAAPDPDEDVPTQD